MSVKKLILIVLLFFFVVGLISAGVLFGYRYLTDVQVWIDRKNYEYEENMDFYYLPEDFIGFEGYLTGPTIFVDTVNYVVLDANNVMISSGIANVDKGTWTVEQPGMMLGLNKLDVTVTMKVGNAVRTTITVYNTNALFQKNAVVDVSDKDGDGLIAYYETFYMTDSENPDTDSDGLSDYVECFYTETDPTRYSTKKDGICDGERDSDDDGVSNLEEIVIGTNPGVYDTDGDGLNDGDEYFIHKTDPLMSDTDGDGASDYWEVDNGYDPLSYDGLFEVKKSAGVEDSAVSASVTLVGGGNPESLCIEPVTVDGLLDETMKGYLGCAYSFSYEDEFQSATITMTFDAGLLDGNAEPTIYYFNEETQLLEELSTTIIGNTASAVVPHFSTYVLLDRMQVSRVVEEDIILPEEGENTVVNIAFVVDYSSSMDENDPEYIRLKIVKEYIAKLREGTDMGALIKFAAYATTLVPLSYDKEMLINATDGIYNTDADSCSSEAGTNGSDGLRHALDSLNEFQEDIRQYIIFLTDGEDTTTSYDYDELIAEAVERNIVIYTVGMGTCNEELLSRIAVSTGGKYHYASTVDYDIDGTLSLKEVFSEIEKETIDFFSDSNEDGITDYYTRLICDGYLTTGTGANPFEGKTYEEIQAGAADFDGDGLTNGEEIFITEQDGFVYLKYSSSPVSIDTDLDGYIDGEDQRCLLWDVGDRDLAIFAALTYEDGAVFKGKMYQASQLKGSEEEEGERYYFLDYASIAPGDFDEGISSKWVIVDYENRYVLMDRFSATTYKCQDNIVISYRGTNETLEWIDNVVCYGMFNYHTEEAYARAYAQKIAERYPEYNIYITGHSLGGYLAQIGTAQLLENTDITPKRVAYFNGIGINFEDHSGIVEVLLPETMESVAEANEYFHMLEMYYLREYAKTGNLISYEIKGDVVSALGSHCGEEIVYEAAMASREHHAGKYGESDFSEWLGNVLGGVFGTITAKQIPEYYEYYGTKSIMEYFWITHETDSFLYHLEQGNRSGKQNRR